MQRLVEEAGGNGVGRAGSGGGADDEPQGGWAAWQSDPDDHWEGKTPA